MEQSDQKTQAEVSSTNLQLTILQIEQCYGIARQLYQLSFTGMGAWGVMNGAAAAILYRSWPDPFNYQSFGAYVSAGLLRLLFLVGNIAFAIGFYHQRDALKDRYREISYLMARIGANGLHANYESDFPNPFLTFALGDWLKETTADLEVFPAFPLQQYSSSYALFMVFCTILGSGWLLFFVLGLLGVWPEPPEPATYQLPCPE